MSKAHIVIGANAGDEGKGTIVARLTKELLGSKLNILTNGGPQRGHTVMTPDNKTWHTFHHLGSGTFYGADTFISRNFLLNPMALIKEKDKLTDKGFTTGPVYIDQSVKWTSPYDMIANQIIENSRGDKKHSSCGMGIFTTITRYKDNHGLDNNLALDFYSFICKNDIGQKQVLRDIKKYYERSVVKNIPQEWEYIWNGQGLIDHFIDDVSRVSRECIFIKPRDYTFITDYDHAIYENGQGLLLSDTGKDEPGKTPTDCGMTYAYNQVVESANFCEVHYVTRPYLTRHGKGLIQPVDKKLISSDIQPDVANHYNGFQGEFLYGNLDLDELDMRIQKDLDGALLGAPISSWTVDVTHCDEMDRSDEFRKKFKNVNFYGTAAI